MRYLFTAISIAYFVGALENPSLVGPTKGNEAKKASQCNVNNYNNFYAGAHCKEIKQQLAEILEEIRELKGNKTSASATGRGLKCFSKCFSRCFLKRFSFFFFFFFLLFFLMLSIFFFYLIYFFYRAPAI